MATNKELVQEINRAIRGVAINYPDGLGLIRAQLEALEAPRAVEVPAGVVEPEAWEGASPAVQAAIVPKKRGRPSNAERAERARLAALVESEGATNGKAADL